jgi:hypothetical protein
LIGYLIEWTKVMIGMRIDLTVIRVHAAVAVLSVWTVNSEDTCICNHGE